MATKTSHRRKAPLKSRDPMAQELELPQYHQRKLPKNKKKQDQNRRRWDNEYDD